MEESEEALGALIQKRYLAKLTENKGKAIQSLLRRGFSYELILKQLEKLD